MTAGKSTFGSLQLPEVISGLLFGMSVLHACVPVFHAHLPEFALAPCTVPLALDSGISASGTPCMCFHVSCSSLQFPGVHATAAWVETTEPLEIPTALHTQNYLVNRKAELLGASGTKRTGGP